MRLGIRSIEPTPEVMIPQQCVDGPGRGVVGVELPRRHPALEIHRDDSSSRLGQVIDVGQIDAALRQDVPQIPEQRVDRQSPEFRVGHRDHQDIDTVFRQFSSDGDVVENGGAVHGCVEHGDRTFTQSGLLTHPILETADDRELDRKLRGSVAVAHRALEEAIAHEGDAQLARFPGHGQDGGRHLGVNRN